MADFLAFAERFGLVVTLLVFAIITSVTGVWFSKPMMEKISAGFERVIASKDEDNKRLLEQKDRELAYREDLIKQLRDETAGVRDENARLTSLLLATQDRADQFANMAGAPRPPVAARRATR